MTMNTVLNLDLAAAAAESRACAEAQRGIGDARKARRMQERAAATAAQVEEARQERQQGRGRRGARQGGGRGVR